MSVESQDRQYAVGCYGRFPLTIARGTGALCYDEEGMEYVDFTSGIGVNSLGYCDEGWVKAVTEQAALLQHTSNLYYTKPAADLAKALCERTGAKKVFFANSGAEANECLIKTARKYSCGKYGAGRSVIVALEGSFHGRTMATLSATGQDEMHKYFYPFLSGFRFVPPGDDLAMLAALEAPDVCGVLLEPVQGEGGVIPLEKSYVQSVANYCAHKDVLLMFDEVQTGIGRTGTLLCAQQLDVRPDMTSLAKGLGGGLPIGAVLMGEKCEKVLGVGDHGSTFGGNPVCCAGALAVLERMTPAFLEDVEEKGRYLRASISGLPCVKNVSGRGLMLGVTLEESVNARELAQQCLSRGALFLTAKKKLRLLPPLTITREEMDKGLKILKEVLTTWPVTC